MKRIVGVLFKVLLVLVIIVWVLLKLVKECIRL